MTIGQHSTPVPGEKRPTPTLPLACSFLVYTFPVSLVVGHVTQFWSNRFKTEVHWRASEKAFPLWCVCVLSHFSRVTLSATLWTAGHQAPMDVGLSRQECRSGLHALLQGIFSTQGLNQWHWGLLLWQAGSIPLAPPGKPSSVIAESIFSACLLPPWGDNQWQHHPQAASLQPWGNKPKDKHGSTEDGRLKSGMCPAFWGYC